MNIFQYILGCKFVFFRKQLYFCVLSSRLSYSARHRRVFQHCSARHRGVFSAVQHVIVVFFSTAQNFFIFELLRHTKNLRLAYSDVMFVCSRRCFAELFVAIDRRRHRLAKHRLHRQQHTQQSPFVPFQDGFFSRMESGSVFFQLDSGINGHKSA